MESQDILKLKFAGLTMKIKKEVQYHLLSMKSKSIYLSDGCHQLKEKEKCSWLFELILAWQSHPQIKKLNYQVWKIKKMDALRYCITCLDNRDLPQFQKHLNVAGFTAGSIEILLKDQVALLPVEI